MKHSLILRFAPVILLFVACNKHYHYAPNTLNVPTVREKGEMSVEVGLTGGSQMSGMDARFAYSPVKHLVFTASYMRLKGSFVRNTFTFPIPTPTEQHSGRGFLAEAGGGFYRNIDEYLSVSILGGWGLGNAFNDYDRARYSNLWFNRAYIQPGLSMQGVLADFSCGLRVSHLNFTTGEVDLRIDENERLPIDRIRNSGSIFLTDLGVCGGLNLSPVRVKCHLTFSLYERNDFYGFSNNNASLALAFDIHKLFNNKRPKKRKS